LTKDCSGANADFSAKPTGVQFMKILFYLATFTLFAIFSSGCRDISTQAFNSTSGKNIDLSGYVMMAEAESVNPETAAPLSKIILGRVNYKSRKVGIPSDQKVPTTGYFRANRTESLFGTSEVIIEYDFTAASETDTRRIGSILEEQCKNAEVLLKK
jgi:hypothetical protein